MDQAASPTGPTEGRSMDAMSGIRIAQSCADDPREAVEEFHAAVAQPDLSLVLFFCSSMYDRDALAAGLRDVFRGAQVVGCTTAGEIGPKGCRERSITGVSFSAGVCRAVTGQVANLCTFEIAGGQAFAHDLLRRLRRTAPHADWTNTFAFLLVDGLSAREELLAHALQTGLGEIALVGGSAGDGLTFGSTHVYHDDGFSSGNAVLTLITSPLPFKVFKTQHFVPTDERLVVTEADASRRVVKEIDGRPAAAEYARILGVPESALDPVHFAASPVVVLIDGANYVRSIQKANPDGTLTFFCAIEEGVVLRVARGVDLTANLEQAFATLRADVGEPQLVLACDCILRKLEIDQAGLATDVAEIFRRNRVVGFNTYGEQFCGVHVNQTLTGVAFGPGPSGTRHD
jgi:hypothetical protein